MRCYDNSVFVNCPFDPEYRPLFEAVVFAIYDCGFYPRCALEVDDGTQVRIRKINRLIGGCRLAVHDISRTEPDAATGLPRFNMPLELGIFLGVKEFGRGEHRRKAAIILDRDLYRYQKYISDIAGQDIRAHRRRPDEAICQLRNFLSIHLDPGHTPPGGDYIARRYAAFRRQLPRTCKKAKLSLEKLTFRDLTNLIVGWIRSYPKDGAGRPAPATPAPAARRGRRGRGRPRRPVRAARAPRP